MILVCVVFVSVAQAELSKDLQYLNGLPLDKLIQLKHSLQDLVGTYDNYTSPGLHNFGAQAMALQSPPLKRTDYDGIYKKDSSKLGSLFTMSVTTLAFLAFGGYLLCLIVQAVKMKHMYNNISAAPTFLIKKKPNTHISSYGRRRRDLRMERLMLDLPPEQMFQSLVTLCEGYAKWNEKFGDGEGVL